MFDGPFVLRKGSPTTVVGTVGTIIPWAAIIGVCRADHATITNHGGITAVISAAIVSRRVAATIVTAVIGRGIAAAVIPGPIAAAIVSVTGTVGIGVRASPPITAPAISPPATPGKIRRRRASTGLPPAKAPLPLSGPGLPQQPEPKVLSSWTTPFRKPDAGYITFGEVPSFAKTVLAKHFRVKFVAQVAGCQTALAADLIFMNGYSGGGFGRSPFSRSSNR